MAERIAPQRMSKHGEAITYVNNLIIDLKKQLLGYGAAPLTMERLDEWTKTHCRDLEQCTQPDRYY